MPLLERSRQWLGLPEPAPRSSREPSSPSPGYRDSFWRRHVWPPTIVGVVVIVLVASVATGFCGGFIYTQTGGGKVELQDPAGPVRPENANPVPTAAPTTGPTTTKLEVLSVEALGEKVGASVWRVTTMDEEGKPVEVSAMVAGSFGGESFLLTSFAAVRAATKNPGPEIIVRNGGSQATATLWTWQEDKDLALLVVPRVSPPLPWAGENHVSKAGDKIFVGAEGAPLAQGKITSVSSTGIVHDVIIDGLTQGAPLVNDRGEVLGMASREYNPGGVGTDRIFIAIPIRNACEQVLSCSSGAAPASPPTTATR
jgi:S1-C subfamily serine protease